MRAGYDDMAVRITTQEDTIVRLEKELQQAHDDIAQRDAMVADMMRRQGEALSQQEMQGLNGGTWVVHCWRSVLACVGVCWRVLTCVGVC